MATCNHWHSLITIWACQAGKDVYVEKPISHNVFEGRKCVEAARNTAASCNMARRTAAAPSVRQSSPPYSRASMGSCWSPRDTAASRAGPLATSQTPTRPPELDFNIWLGPAPEQPYHGNLVPYNWHWFWDTGNGDIGNQGVHEIDIARWAIKDSTLPRSVWSLGGRFGYEDQGQTPNTQMAVFDYGGPLLVFEVRGLVGNKDRGDLPNKVTNEFYMTDGVIRDGLFYRNGNAEGEPITGFEGRVTPGGTFGSFIHAIRSRKPEDVNANAEVAHYSAALCHLANISYRLGSQVPFDKSSGSLGDNKFVVETFNNLRDNLNAIGMKLDNTTYQLGRTLQFDAQTERFVGDGADDANPLLSRPIVRHLSCQPRFSRPSPTGAAAGGDSSALACGRARRSNRYPRPRTWYQIRAAGIGGATEKNGLIGSLGT